MNAGDLADRLELALDGARRAGALTLDYFERRDFAVERKADATPVTIADREAEQLLRATFAEHFPADGVLGEEFGERPGTSGFRWIVDPIDGTKAFVSGVPMYGTLIGLEHEGRSLLGVIHLPALDETVWGLAGAGAWYRRGTAAERPARVSNCASLAESVFVTSEGGDFRQNAPTGRLPSAGGRRAQRPHLGRLLRLCPRGHRSGGSDGRSGDERVGRRGAAADSRSGRGHVHRLAGPSDDS